MESKCRCEWSSKVSHISCTCGDQRIIATPSKVSKVSSNSFDNSVRIYCPQEVVTTTTTASAHQPNPGFFSTNSIFCKKGDNQDLLKDMASSWKYPNSTTTTLSSCLAPCISSRRLNRSYSEQRMRCLLTTTIAFCLGISVGALLPFVFPPVDILPSNTESVLNARVNFQIAQPQRLIHTPSYSISSVSGNSDDDASIAHELDSSKLSGGGEKKNASNAIVSSTPIFSPVTFVDSNSLNNLENFQEKTSGKKSVTDGIFWSDWVERLLPKGFSDRDVSHWRSLTGNSTVSRVESGCGRMQNRLITYDKGDKACCRYRQNFDQIQGEIFSFYLSQLLGIKNLAPSTLDVINSKSGKWSGVLSELESAQWVDDKPVVLTQFVNNLNPAFIPPLLRSSTRRVHPPDVPPVPLSQFEETQVNSSDTSKIFDNISELAQWSDLIVFDYLTANLDRMVNNLYNLQWNPTMMDAPAHNLAKDENGLLVFLDNESGLLHGYRLLDKYEHYHRLMLDSLCIFRKSTVEAIKRLHSYGSIQPLFKSMLSQFSSSQLLPMIPDKSIKVLNQRIDTVHRQIQQCQSLYMKTTNT